METAEKKTEQVICYYCGKVITDIHDNNNADDHTNPDTIGKRCCKHCNDTIVVPARIRAWMGRG